MLGIVKAIPGNDRSIAPSTAAYRLTPPLVVRR